MARFVKQPWYPPHPENDSKPLPMAEPRPRVSMSTSGVSLRDSDIPQSSMQRIKDICIHYVSKCTGKYIDNKAAARYVHAMSDEIIVQLSGLQEQIAALDLDPKVYKNMLDEWKRLFPPSMGSPKAVANLLAKQENDIKRLQYDLDASESKQNQAIQDTIAAAEIQLGAFRDGILNERRQMAVAQDLMQQEHRTAIESLTISAKDHIASLEQAHKEALAKLKAQHERDFNATKTSFQQSESRLQDELQGLNRQLQQTRSTLTQQLKDQKANFTTILGAAGIHVHDVALSETALTPEDAQRLLKKVKQASLKSAMDNYEAVASKGADASVPESFASQDEELAYRKNQAEALLMQTDDLKAEIGLLNEQLSGLSHDNEIKNRGIEKLQQDVAQVLAEKSVLLSRLKDLDELKEQLRKTLSLFIGNDKDGPEILSKPFVLAHTPHFLGKADRFGLNRNPQQEILTAYNTAGRF